MGWDNTRSMAYPNPSAREARFIGEFVSFKGRPACSHLIRVHKSRGGKRRNIYIIHTAAEAAAAAVQQQGKNELLYLSHKTKGKRAGVIPSMIYIVP